MISKYIL